MVAVISPKSATAEVYSTELITNGDFFAGLTGWTGSNIDAANNLEDQYPISGLFLTLGQIAETESASQTVTVPAGAGAASLTFYYRFYGSTDTSDYFRISVNDTIITMMANTDAVTAWAEYTLDLSAYRGQEIAVKFLVYNNADKLSFADVDLVSLMAESYPELTGIVKNRKGQRLRNAIVTIRTAKTNKKVWTGTTNKKGKFLVDELAGGKTYKVLIKKDDLKTSTTVQLVWAKAKKKTFIVK